MDKAERQEVSRREFLRLSLAGAAILSVFGIPGINAWADGKPDSGIPRLNPGFGIRKTSENEVELYTNTGNGKMLTHRFTGLEADIFRKIEKGISPESVIPILSQKHGMKEPECRRKMLAFLREFKKARLVCYDEKMMVWRTERDVQTGESNDSR